MHRKPVDNLELERWRALDCLVVLRSVADYLKEDKSFAPRECLGTTRWHVTVAGLDYELLCTGSRYFDTLARQGSGGGVDLVMHLFRVDFKRAAALLHKLGL